MVIDNQLFLQDCDKTLGEIILYQALRPNMYPKTKMADGSGRSQRAIKRILLLHISSIKI